MTKALRNLIDEMRNIAMVAGQYSIETPERGEGQLSAAQAERCRDWANRIEALLSSHAGEGWVQGVRDGHVETLCILRCECGEVAATAKEVNMLPEQTLCRCGELALMRADRCEVWFSPIEPAAPSPATPSEPEFIDEEETPHTFQPVAGESDADGPIWCTKCCYHRDYAVHAPSPATPEQPPVYQQMATCYWCSKWGPCPEHDTPARQE